MTFKIIHKDKKTKARTGILIVKNKKIKTPFFMPVATKASVKHLSTEEINEINAKAIISNTFVLHLRPGEAIIKKLGGIGKFMNYNGINVTDSGGFQMYSTSLYLNSNSQGVFFKNPLSGEKIFITPEKDMKIQLDLGSDIAMCLDCMPLFPSTKKQVQQAIEKTAIWAKKCKQYHDKLQKNKKQKQLLFGITQGGIYLDLRKQSSTQLKDLDFDGYSIGGLALGESHEQELKAIEAHKSIIPESKPSYLMGAGHPIEILESIARGVDMFDSRYPTQNARRGTIFTSKGKIKIFNKKYETDKSPLDKNCNCKVCKNYTKAYIRYQLKQQEGIGLRLASYHNLYFLQQLLEKARKEIEKGKFKEFLIKFKKDWKD